MGIASAVLISSMQSKRCGSSLILPRLELRPRSHSTCALSITAIASVDPLPSAADATRCGTPNSSIWKSDGPVSSTPPSISTDCFLLPAPAFSFSACAVAITAVDTESTLSSPASSRSIRRCARWCPALRVTWSQSADVPAAQQKMLPATWWILCLFLSMTKGPPVERVSAPSTTPSRQHTPTMVVPVFKCTTGTSTGDEAAARSASSCMNVEWPRPCVGNSIDIARAFIGRPFH
mmetsp:Transcript_11501/g.25532  ORF Transcript_11501/g.25532 Transcript_11501/m.25532 type:complete len:235 (+) Transcript_11501:307-1011(+)